MRIPVTNAGCFIADMRNPGKEHGHKRRCTFMNFLFHTFARRHVCAYLQRTHDDFVSPAADIIFRPHNKGCDRHAARH